MKQDSATARTGPVMRLTLRTMLAFRDGLLGAEDSQAIASRIAASDFAKRLFFRLDQVGDDVLVANSTLEPDPNTLASYLDNTLPPDQVPVLEKSFLDSDALLEELAACHVILSQVLDHPLRVERERRERMYLLRPTDLTAPDEIAADEMAVDATKLEVGAGTPSDDDILNWMVADATSNSRTYQFVNEGATDLSGGTATLVAPPAVESASNFASAAATAHVQAATRARHAPKQRRSESHTHAPDQAWNGTNWLSSALGVVTARPVLSLSVLGTAFCAAICLPVFGSFSAPLPQPIKVAVHAYGLPEVAGEPCTLLDGQITCQAGQGRFADAGAIVIAWPAGVTRQAKFTTLRVFSELNTVPQKLPPMQLYVGQTDERGDYRLRLKPDREFHVLVLSSNARRDGDISGADREILAARFEDPDKLLGSRGYQLAQCKVVNGAIKHDFQLGRAAK